MLGCVAPLTYKSQKDVFSEIIEETLGEQCNFETVKNLHENLSAYVDEHKDEPDPVAFDKADVKRALEQSGVENKHIEAFSDNYDDAAGSRTSFMASNVVNPRTFEVKAPDVIIKVSPDRTDLIETRQIDGKTYLMVELTDNVEVNGINVKPI